jgi:hypothetical protein
MDYAMSCNRLSVSCLRRHDHWKQALKRFSTLAGCNAGTDPSCTCVGVAAAGPHRARVDVKVTLASWTHIAGHLPDSSSLPDLRCQCFPDAGHRCRSAGQEQIQGACGPSSHRSHLCACQRRDVQRKDNQIGDHALPQQGSASAPRAGRNRRGQRAATRDAGGSVRADRARRASPEANTRAPAGTGSSATEAPTKKTTAITEHTASRREREQPSRQEKRSKSQGMQCAGTESALKEST